MAGLDEVVEERGLLISEVVRGLIGDAYEAVTQERRRAAARRLVTFGDQGPARSCPIVEGIGGGV